MLGLSTKKFEQNYVIPILTFTVIILVGGVLIQFNSQVYAASQEAQAEYHFQQGLAALQFGEYKKAVSLFDQALKYDPNFIDALINKGSALSELGKQQEAILNYDKVLEIDQNNAIALNNKGYALSKMEKFDDAVSYYNRALEIDPAYLDALYNRANAFWKQWYCEDAIIYYDQIIEIDPEPSQAYLHKAWAFSSLGQVENAISNLDLALEVDPNILKEFHGSLGGNFAVFADSKEWSETYWQNLLPKYSNVWQGVSSKTLSFDVYPMDKAELDTVCIKPSESDQYELFQQAKEESSSLVPDWIRNNAKWWAQGSIDDKDFTSGIQFLINEGIIQIPGRDNIETSNDWNTPITENGYLQVKGNEFFINEDQKILVEFSGQYLGWQEHIGPIELYLIDPRGNKDRISVLFDGENGEFSKVLRFDHFDPLGEYTLKGVLESTGTDIISSAIGPVKFYLKSGNEKRISPEPEIPQWIKNNADWWSQGLITDDDFVKGIQYLVEQGIIQV